MNYKAILTLLVVALTYFNGLSQDLPKRKIIEVTLTTDSNQGFNRYGIELPTILFSMAAKDSLDLYYFDDFNLEPRLATFSEFKKSIELPVDLYDDWNESLTYYLFDMVSYKGVNYICEEDDNQGNEPGQNPEIWKPEETIKYGYSEITSVFIDQTVTSNGEVNNYLHFNLPEFVIDEYDNSNEILRYIVSVKASDAIRVLNSSNYAWYNTPMTNQSFNHLVGDVFLDNASEYMIDGLKQALKHIDKDVNLREYYNSDFERYEIALRYDYINQSRKNFYLCGGDDFLEIGEIIRYNSEKFKQIDVDVYQRLGDALIDGKLKGEISIVEYDNIKTDNIEQVISSESIDKLETRILEEIDLRYYTNQDHSESFDSAISDVMKAVLAGDIPMYFFDFGNLYKVNDGLMDKTNAFVVENNDPENGLPFNDYRTYKFADMVTVGKKKYYSLINDNLGNEPEFSPMSWGTENPWRYTQSDIRILDILYTLEFTNHGQITSKVPEYVFLTVPTELDDKVINLPIGAIKYEDFKSLNKSNSDHWKKVINELEKQELLIYRMMQYAPLKATD